MAQETGKKRGVVPESLRPYCFTSERQPVHKGRPKGRFSLKKLMEKAMCEEAREGKSHAELFVRNELARGISGDGRAATVIWTLFEEDARSGDSGIAKVIIEHVFTGKPYYSPGPAPEPGEGSAGTQAVYDAPVRTAVGQDPTEPGSSG